MVGNWWYKRRGGDSTRKKKSKIWNKNFSFEALFSRKSTLNLGSVRLHFTTSRYNGSHCRSLSRWILSQFVCFCRNGKLGIHNEIIWSNHKVYYYKNCWKCCPFCRTHTSALPIKFLWTLSNIFDCFKVWKATIIFSFNCSRLAISSE